MVNNMVTTTKIESVNWDTILLKQIIRQLGNVLDTLEKSKALMEKGDNEKALTLLNMVINDLKPYIQFLGKAL